MEVSEQGNATDPLERFAAHRRCDIGSEKCCINAKNINLGPLPNSPMLGIGSTEDPRRTGEHGSIKSSS